MLPLTTFVVYFCLCCLLLNLGNFVFPLKKDLYALSKFNCAFARARESTSLSQGYAGLYLAGVECLRFFNATLSPFSVSYISIRSASILLYTNRTQPKVFLSRVTCSFVGYRRNLYALLCFVILNHLCGKRMYVSIVS